MTVLLQTGTHCWHQLCRWPDKSKANGIRFTVLHQFELICLPNRFKPIIPSSNSAKACNMWLHSKMFKYGRHCVWCHSVCICCRVYRWIMDQQLKSSRLISMAVVLSVEWQSSVTSLLETQKGLHSCVFNNSLCTRWLLTVLFNHQSLLPLCSILNVSNSWIGLEEQCSFFWVLRYNISDKN